MIERRETRPLLVLAAYTLLALVMTWPLARGLTRDLPADFGDPLLNSWVMAWDAEHLLAALSGHPGELSGYWNANIYHPHPLALAYSEHLTPQALMILPVYASTRNVILCYNVVFLATFVLSAFGMYLFVRDLTGSGWAALLAGVAFGFAPYRFGTLPHVQILSSMWMPFALWGFHRYFETRRVAALAGGTAAWIAQNLSCGYYLLFFTPALALSVAWEITRRTLWRDRTIVLQVVAAAAIAAVATAPFLLPYWRLRQLGFNARSLAETIQYSADVHAYFTVHSELWLWGRVVRAFPKSEGAAFPGFTIVVLAGVAVWQQWLEARRASSGIATSSSGLWLTVALSVAVAAALALLAGWSFRSDVAGAEVQLRSLDRTLLVVAALAMALAAVSRRARATARVWLASPVATLVLVTAFAFVMSLGPAIHARGRVVEPLNLYAFFFDYVPGFDGVRVPARFAMIVALGLAALAGWGAALVARTRHGRIAIALATALVVAESWAAPIPLNVNSTTYKQNGLMPLPDRLEPRPQMPSVYRFVNLLPVSSALLELPFGEVAFETRYMYYSTSHWRPLVNGYSGGGPDEYGLRAERFKDLLQRPDVAWEAVLASRATHLVVHEASYAGDRGRLISEWARAHGALEVGVFGTDRVFSVPR